MVRTALDDKLITQQAIDSAAPVRPRIRLTLDVSPELNALLMHLAEETDSSKSDVLRRAVALMEVAIEARKNGNRLGVVDGRSRQLLYEIISLGL